MAFARGDDVIAGTCSDKVARRRANDRPVRRIDFIPEQIAAITEIRKSTTGGMTIVNPDKTSYVSRVGDCNIVMKLIKATIINAMKCWARWANTRPKMWRYNSIAKLIINTTD